MKKRRAKVFAVLMTVMMLIGSVNFSYAAQPENGNGGGTTNTTVEKTNNSSDNNSNQTENNSSSDSKSSVKEDSNKSNSTNKSNSASGESSLQSNDKNSSENQEADEDTNASQDEIQPLSKVIRKAYVYLTDASDKHKIDSSDPSWDKLSKDNVVTPGQKIKVEIDLKDIIENNGASGIQEGVTYYMDLPEELVTDSDSKYLNPDKPVKFINDGTLTAKGGIYTSGNKEQLRITFSNVESRTDVSGGFIYSAYINSELEKGKTYKVDMGPCGNVSIKIGSAKKLTVKGGFNSEYSHDYTASSETSMYWSVKYDNLEDSSDLKNNIWINLNNSVFDLHIKDDNSTTIEDMEGTVTYENGTTETLTKQRANRYTYNFYPKSQYNNGNTNHLFSINMDNSQYYSQYEDLNMTDNKSQIISRFAMVMGDYDSQSKKAIKSIELRFKSEPTNNNIARNSSYTVNASVNSDGNTISANDSVYRYYYDSDANLKTQPDNTNVASWNSSSDFYNGSCKYSGLPGSIKTNIDVNSSKSFSDYYEFEFNASNENSLNAYYEFCPWAFFGKENLSGGSSFSKFSVAGNTEWQFMGSSDYDNYMRSIETAIDYYRIKSVLKKSSESKFWFWKSKSKVNGRYLWVAIPNSQYELAQSNYKNANMSYYTSSYKSLKPEKWKMYIFNTSGTESNIEFYQRLGALNSGDVSSGKILDELISRSNASGLRKSASTIGTTKKDSMASLRGYDMGNDLIRWEVSLDLTNLDDYIGYNNYYANISDGQTITNLTSNQFSLKNNSTFKDSVSETQNGGYGLFVYDSGSKTWKSTQFGLWGKNSESASNSLDFDASKSKPIEGMSYATSGGSGLDKYKDSDGTVKLCYFTKKNDSNTSVSSLKSQFEVNFNTSELVHFNHLKNGAVSTKLRAITKNVAAKGKESAKIDYTLTKDVEEGSNSYSGKTYNTWTIKANAKRNEDGTIGLINDFNVSDKMSNIKATVDDKEVDVDPSDYISMDSLTVRPSYLTSYSSNDIKTATDATSHEFDQAKSQEQTKSSTYKIGDFDELGISGGKVNWSSTLKYSGNVKDGFDLKVNDLEGVTSIDIKYTTSFDRYGYIKALKEAGVDVSMNSNIQLTQSNSAVANCGNDDTKKSASKTKTDKFKTELSLDKSVEQEGTESASYTLKSETGTYSVKYFKLSDYLTSYKTNGKKITDRDALEALAKCFNVSNLKITCKERGEKEKVIYEDGQSKNGYSVKFNEKTGAELFNLEITKDRYYDTIPGNSVITITYDGSVDIGKCVEDSNTFRLSDYYQDGELYIVNNAKATTPIPENNSITYSSDDGVGYVDNDAKTLNCYAGSGVGATYLAEPNAKKHMYHTSSSSDGTNYSINAYTGSTGKTCPEKVVLEDYLAFIPRDIKLTDKDKTLTDEQKEYYTDVISLLLAKHSYYYNLDVYRGDCGEDVMTDICLDGLEDMYFTDSNLVATHKDTITHDEELGNNVNLKYKPITKAISDLVVPGGREYYGKAVILTVGDMHLSMFASAKYNIKTDWKSFYKEAKTLETKYGYNVVSDLSWNYSIYNVLSSLDKTSSTEQSGSKVEIASKRITKDSSNVDEGAGTADWSVNANTGLDSGTKLTLSDKASVKADDDTVKAAAEKYTTITNVKVKKEGKVIYEEGGKGNSSHVTVKVDRLNITAEIEDIDIDTDYTLEYTTKLDKSAFINEVGMDKAYSLSNVASMTTKGSTITADKSASFKPSEDIKATKSFVDSDDESGVAKWNITTSSGNIDRENFKITDTVESDDKDNLSISDMTIKVGDKSYNITKDGLPQGAHLYKADGTTNFKLGQDGSTDFVLVFDRLPANTDISVDYTVKVAKDAYSAKTNHTISMKNSAVISDKWGTEKKVSDDGKTYIPKVMSKKVTKTSKDDEGNTVLDWDINVDLTSKFSDEQIANAENVTVTDDLVSALEYQETTVYKAEVTSDGIERGDKLSADQYTITTEDNQVKVAVKDPKTNNKFVVNVKTVAVASVDSISNSAVLTLGSKTIKTTSDETPSIESVKQYGYIKSKGTPEYTPTAEKYVNHKRVSNSDEIFSFKAVEVTPNDDGTYSEVKGGYSSEARNDENGDITFDTDKYTNADTREGDHYYKITESKNIVSGKADAKYTMDDTEFIVKVSVTKLSNGGYSVVDQVVSPDNYSTVKFDNAKETTRNFKVTKTWDDNNNKAQKRPKSITVYLLNNGERYNNMSATLNEDNNWTYEFKNLPIADANYSVEEGSVENYQATILTDEWQATINNKYVPNTNDNIKDFTVTKKWDDNDNAAGKRPKSITVYLTKDGKRYNNMSATLSEKNNWTYTFKDLPADEDGKFSVEEESVDYYEGTVTTAEWSATITNKYIKDNPNTPTNPTTPTDTTGKTTTEHGTKTGDNTPIGILLGLMAVAALGSGFVAFGKRKRE